jgi:RNA ligase (TIGR02306 family)
MAEFKCEVVRVNVVPHGNADRLEIAEVGDFRSIIGKGYINDGDLAVYIPEGAVVPEWLLRELKLWDETKGKGMCAGSLGNRVKAIKLRGVLSQGLVYRTNCGEEENSDFTLVDANRTAWQIDSVPVWESQGFGVGDDVAEFLGIEKYQPALPSHMAGKAIGVDLDITHNYDFENIKKHPNMFEEGEDVVITEKIHGTLIQIAVIPESMADERYYKGRVVLTSKGLGGRGIILDHNDETNLYAQAAKKYGLLDSMLETCGLTANIFNKPMVLFGEVFGRTLSGAVIQDLTYNDEPLCFRAFDIGVGVRNDAMFVGHDDLEQICEYLNIETVPVLYRGSFSKSVVSLHTDGNTTMTDKKQIREGVVVKQVGASMNHSRKIAKSISEAYLLRKSEHATEYA